MNSLLNEINLSLPKIAEQTEVEHPLAQLRFYDTLTNWSWYLIEFDGQDLCFGLVIGLVQELGYFTLSELDAVNSDAGFPRIRRDVNFVPCEISKITDDWSPY